MGALRRTVTALTALGTAVAALAALPAAADEPDGSAVTDATLTWGISGYAQVGIFGPWTLSDAQGDARVLTGSVSGGTQSVYTVEPVPATSMPRSSPQKTPNVVRFAGGEGTVDPQTGAAELAWTGSYTVNAYPDYLNAPDEVYADPVLQVARNGAGTLSFEVTIGAGVDLDGDPSAPQRLGRVTVLTFTAGARSALDEDSFRLTPDYRGVTVDGAAAGVQVRSCSTAGGATGWWGSWPAAFVTAMPVSLQTHFYSTTCGGAQDYKPALPVDVGFGFDEPEPEPTATATPTPGPTTTPTPTPAPTTPAEPGALSWSFTDDAASLGTATLADGVLAATGTLPAVTISDTRADSPGFTLSGRARPFTTSDGAHVLGAQHLGWQPSLLEAVAGVRAGRAIAPSTAAGRGLATSRTLVVGGPTSVRRDVRVTAGLTLRVPEGAAPGRYETVLTITALG
ncbi:hypothetical protein [Cellulomonas persica]|uniref:Htaa domain-containing protein n=1 Tax=Cellulomonas persica TaxID=76861 RepID=A0A510UTD2_9CELL|nr:hypothetical protein [Cellulomonas persica]GEK17933.1 hypothetical protein CPE01_16660 [Cellulomonas persica]